MKWRSSLLLIRMEWSIRLSDELNRKHMEWAILCASGFSFWVDRTYVFPDIIFLGDRTYVFPDIIFLRGIELMCFQIFFRGQNLCVSRYFS